MTNADLSLITLLVMCIIMVLVRVYKVEDD